MILDEPVRGAYPEVELFGLSGLEQMRSFLRRRGPRPPISHLTGMMPVEIDPGRATFTMPASPWMLSPAGVIQGGMLAVLADAPLGCAVHTALPPATGYTTSELSMTFLRRVTPESGLLTGRGTLIHAGRSLALSQVSVTDQSGRLVAHGTSRCFVFPPLDLRNGEVTELPPLSPPEYDAPDPYLRPVEGAALPPEVWDEMSGLDVLHALIKEELPAPPVHHLTGIRPLEAAEGRATVAMPASEWLCSPLAKVQGGVTALLADTALSLAIQTTVPAGRRYATVDLKVNFLRPAQADGHDLVAHGSVAHRGKTLAIGNAEVVNADGKRVALATGTAQILDAR